MLYWNIVLSSNRSDEHDKHAGLGGSIEKRIAYSTNGTTMRYPYHNQWFCGCGHFFGMEITLVAGMELAPDVPVHNKWAHDTQ